MRLQAFAGRLADRARPSRTCAPAGSGRFTGAAALRAGARTGSPTARRGRSPSTARRRCAAEPRATSGATAGRGRSRCCFDDGRFFHRFDAEDRAAGRRHDCAPDLYRVRYDFRALAALAGGVAGDAGRARTTRMVGRYRRASDHERSSLAALLLVARLCAGRAAAGTQAPNADGLYRCDARLPRRPRGRGLHARSTAARGFVIIKDDDPDEARRLAARAGPRRDRHRGPAVFRPPVADFWALGWAFGGQLLPAPPADRALAINSKAGRDQNLLHIHISCVPLAVRDGAGRPTIGPRLARPDPSSTSTATPTTCARSERSSRVPFLLFATCRGRARTWRSSRWR